MVHIFGNPNLSLIFLTILRISFQLILLRIPSLKILKIICYLSVPPHKFQPSNASSLEISVREYLTKHILLSFYNPFHFVELGGVEPPSSLFSKSSHSQLSVIPNFSYHQPLSSYIQLLKTGSFFNH